MASPFDGPIEPVVPETHRKSRLRVLGIFLVASWLVLDLVSAMVYRGMEDPITFSVTLLVLSALELGLLIVGLSILLSTAEGFRRPREISPKQVLLFKGLVTLIAVAAVVLSLVVGFPSFRGTPPDVLRYVVISIYLLVIGTAAIAFVLSLALAWLAADQPGARALALFMAFLALFWGPLLHTTWVGYDSVERQLNFGSSWGANGWLGGITPAALLLSVAAFVRFSALFPRLLTEHDLGSSKLLRPLRAIRIKLLRPAIVWGVAGGLAIYLLWPNFGPGADGTAIDPGALEAYWNAFFLGQIVLVFVVLPLLGMSVGALNLRAGYVSSVESERKRIRWVVVGCVVGTCMILAALAGAFVSNWPVLEWAGFLLLLLPFAPLVVVVCLGIAIFHKGEVHPAPEAAPHD